jgi:hypothetical protein
MPKDFWVAVLFGIHLKPFKRKALFSVAFGFATQIAFKPDDPIDVRDGGFELTFFLA